MWKGKVCGGFKGVDWPFKEVWSKMESKGANTPPRQTNGRLPLSDPLGRKVALKHNAKASANHTVVVCSALAARDAGASLIAVVRPSHTLCWFVACVLAANKPIRGQTPQTPTLSDFACWITLNQTEKICSRTRPSLRKRFRLLAARPVCSSLNKR